MRTGKPLQPPLRGGDASSHAWLCQAWSAYERQLARVDWRHQEAAATAAVCIAVLRLDVVANPAAIAAWVKQPVARLVEPGWVVANGRLDPVTRLALAAYARHHPGQALAAKPGALMGRVEAALQALAPPGCGTLWRRVARAAARARVLQLPVAVRTAMDIGTPLSPHSRWRTDHGPVPAAARVVAGQDLQAELVVHARPLHDAAAVAVLRALGSALRGESVADLGRRSVPTRPQAARIVAQTLQAHPWGGLESIVLRWSQWRLEDPAGQVKPQSIARYLSALTQVITAQDGQPVVSYDTTSQDWYADPARWRVVAAALRSGLSDQATVRALAQMHQQMQRDFPVLRELDLGLLGGLGTPAQVASHVVTPDEFEQALDGLWTAGGDAARGAVAAALQFYMGLRLSETLGLLAADVVPHGEGMVRVWAHAGRKLKTRARRLRMTQFLPAHWRERVLTLAQVMQACGVAGAYLLANPRAPEAAPQGALMHLPIGRLRQVTGDSSITAHSLRHSMATWAALQMLLARCPGLHAYPAHVLCQAAFTPEATQAWAQAWFGGAVPARPLRELARVLGHAGSLRSLRSYVHVMDLAQRGLDTLMLPAPGRGLLAQLLDLDMAAFKRLEKRARARLSRVVGQAPFPTAWALIAELDRVHVHPAVAPVPLPPAATTAPLRVEDLPVVLSLLDRQHAPGLIAQWLQCPLASVARVHARRQEGAIAPAIPARRSRAGFDVVARVLDAPGDRVHGPRALAAWRRGRAISAQRRHWADAAHAWAMLPLLGAILRQRPGAYGAQLMAVMPPDGLSVHAMGRVAAQLKRMQAAANAPGMCTRLVTWRELRLPVQDPAPSLQGCHLVLVVGTPSQGRALGNGQTLLAALDAAALLGD